MRLELLDYQLPEEAIARRPPAERSGGRLLVVDPRAAGVEDRRVAELAHLIPSGSLVVVNDTRVVRARLLGHKPTGGAVELLLVRRADGDRSTGPWGPPDDRAIVARFRALGRGFQPFRLGTTASFGDGRLTAKLERRDPEDGLLEVTLSTADERPLVEALDELGHVPLPPYMARDDEPDDRERYQTVYARVPGAVAAPTAGLHLTDSLLREIEAAGSRVARLTLHVGLGTFQSVNVPDLDQHEMHAEWMDVSPALARDVEAARAMGKPVVAVGTTVVRALESAADPERPGHVRPFSGETRLLIQPGYRFRVVDALLTNFHLPQSTLLALVCAFAGRERILAAYGEAVRRGYRFYSYGDAMWIAARDAPGADSTT